MEIWVYRKGGIYRGRDLSFYLTISGSDVFAEFLDAKMENKFDVKVFGGVGRFIQECKSRKLRTMLRMVGILVLVLMGLLVLNWGRMYTMGIRDILIAPGGEMQSGEPLTVEEKFALRYGELGKLMWISSIERHCALYGASAASRPYGGRR